MEASMNAKDFRNYDQNRPNELLKDYEQFPADEQEFVKATNIFIAKSTKYISIIDFCKNGNYSKSEREFMEKTVKQFIDYINYGPNSTEAVMKEMTKRFNEFAIYYKNISSKDIEHIRVSASNTQNAMMPVFDDKKLNKELKKFYAGYDYITTAARFFDYLADKYGDYINNEHLYGKLLSTLDAAKNLPCIKAMEESLEKYNLASYNQPHVYNSKTKLNAVREDEQARIR